MKAAHLMTPVEATITVARAEIKRRMTDLRKIEHQIWLLVTKSIVPSLKVGEDPRKELYEQLKGLQDRHLQILHDIDVTEELIAQHQAPPDMPTQLHDGGADRLPDGTIGRRMDRVHAGGPDRRVRVEAGDPRVRVDGVAPRPEDEGGG